MKRAAIGLAVLLPALGLFACTPQTQAPATETAATEKSACDGLATPIAGACTTDEVFLGNGGPPEELQGPKCVWKMQEVQRTPDEVLVFRAQDCRADGIGLATYAFTSPTELSISQPGAIPGQPIDNVIAYVFDIPAGKTAGDVAMTKLADAPEKERARCKVVPDATGSTFQLAPDETLMAELKKDQDGPISACGPFGYTEESQVWWEAHGTHAIFHSTGQDTPGWDPKRFIFYTRDAGGKWVKESAAPAP